MCVVKPPLLFLLSDLANSYLKNCKPLSIPYGINSNLLKRYLKPFTQHGCYVSHLFPNPAFTKNITNVTNINSFCSSHNLALYNFALGVMPWNPLFSVISYSHLPSWRMTTSKARFNCISLPLWRLYQDSQFELQKLLHFEPNVLA